MNEKLHGYLDGEIGLEALSPELRREAEAWRGFLAEVVEAGAPGAPVGLQSRIVRAVREESCAGPWSRLRDWWVAPRPIRVRPLVGLAAAAAAVVALLVWPGGPGAGGGMDASSMVAAGSGEGDGLYVQFVLEAPGARSVALAGDFTGWAPEIELEDPDGDGVWSGRARLSPGFHKYMFLVDGRRWVTDPFAERYSEDGFGHRNAVLAITGGGAGAASLAP